MTTPVYGSYLYAKSGTPDGVVCGTIRDFLVLSLLSDEFSIQWSAINDASSWPTPNTDAARAVQSGKQTLNPHFGFVTGIAGNDFYGYIFQQRGITKAVYVGGDVVFSFDTFEEGRGCFEYGRFEQIDDKVFFESEFGYHMLENDQITDIGLGQVDDSYTPVSSTEQQDVAVNPGIHSVFFQSQDLAYNYKTDHWSRLPAFNGNGYYSVDSATGVIGQIVWSGNAADLQLSTGGVPTTCLLTTPETDPHNQGRSVIFGVRPLVNGGTWTVRVGSRDNLSTTISFSASTSLTSRTGVADFREEGRYHRAELTCADGFTVALGMDLEFEPAGLV